MSDQNSFICMILIGGPCSLFLLVAGCRCIKSNTDCKLLVTRFEEAYSQGFTDRERYSKALLKAVKRPSPMSCLVAGDQSLIDGIPYARPKCRRS